MKYQGTLIRPPSEASSLIVQLTYGCSDNGCIFCPAYKKQKFIIRDMDEIKEELRQASIYYGDTNRIFFADGDAIIIPQNKLIEIFDYTNELFPRLSRIGVYGSVKSLKNKSVDDLKELKKRKLGIIYLGIETGSEIVYNSINKYGSPKECVDTCLKIKEASIKLNTTVILGLGGKKYTEDHALKTAKILNESKPDQIAALTLMIVKGSPMYDMLRERKFEELDKIEYVEELYKMISNTQDFKCLFFSNHASNYYPIQARFPKDKEQILKDLKYLLTKKTTSTLKPDFLRGL